MAKHCLPDAMGRLTPAVPHALSRGDGEGEDGLLCGRHEHGAMTRVWVTKNPPPNIGGHRLSHHTRTTLQRAHTRRHTLAKQLTGLISDSYSRSDGSLRGLNGNAGIGFVDQSAAAPATVSGESVVTSHWGPRLREGDDEIAIREPGDLPSVVVTRERIGRGVSVGALSTSVEGGEGPCSR